MFADDTNLFCSHKNIKTLFQIVNSELKLLTEWFLPNKLSLNTKKKKKKILGVIIDENLTWKNNIEVVENKFPNLSFNLYFQQKRAPKLSICHLLIERSV